VQLSNLLVGKAEVLAHARIFRHAQKVLAATEFVPVAPLPATPVLSGSAEFAPAATLEFMRALTPFVLPASTKLMLALPRAGPLCGTFLSPRDNRSRQQNHQT
jgi:hypothetical protein